MGERSITKLTIAGETVRSYLHWGSPEYQIPAFADFVYWTWSTSRPWSLATWGDFLAGVGPNHLPTDPSDDFHGDLGHYYRITIGADGTLAYAYRHRSIDADLEWTDWETRYRADSRLGLYRLAEAVLGERRRSIEYMLQRRPGDERARGHLAWIEVLEGNAAVWQRIEQLPGAAGTPSLTAAHERHDCGLVACADWDEILADVPTNWSDPNQQEDAAADDS